MAIEFQCPYCTATIRVPDAFAGKRGSCPKCATKVLVPAIAPPPGYVPPAARPAPAAGPIGPSVPVPPLPRGPIGPPPSFAGAAHSVAPARGAAPSMPAAPDATAFDPREADPPGIQFAAYDHGTAATAEYEFAPGALRSGVPPAPAPPDGSATADLPTIPPGASTTARGPVQEYPLDALEAAGGRTGRRRRRRRVRWGIPAFFILVLAGALVLLLKLYQTRLEGRIVVQAFHQVELPPGIVPRGVAVQDLPPKTVDFVLRRLKESPQVLAGNLSRFELRGTDDGIRVHLGRSETTQFVRVDLYRQPGVKEFVQKHGHELDPPRDAELKANVRKFFIDAENAYFHGEPFANLADYVDPVLGNVLTSSLGWHVEAVADGTIYRCQYEDAQGNVYFLLPPKVVQFVLRGRKLPDGSVRLPVEYEVTVRLARDDPNAAPEEPDGTATTPGSGERPGIGEMPAPGATPKSGMVEP